MDELEAIRLRAQARRRAIEAARSRRAEAGGTEQAAGNSTIGDGTSTGEIKLHGPDGSTFAFPAGTSRDVIEGAMRSHYSGGAPSDIEHARSQAIANARRRRREAEGLPPEYAGKAMNATAGINEAIYGTLGAPVDLMRGAMNLGISGINKLAGTDIDTIPEDSFGGSRFIAEQLGGMAPQLDPQNTVAQTGADRLMRGIGQGVGYTLAPEAALAGLSRAGAVGPRVGETAGRVFGRGESVGAVAGNAVAGGAAGGGAVAGMALAPDEWKPLAGIAGGLVGGGAGVAVTGVPRLARSGTEVARDFVAPMRESGRREMAGRKILESASDPAALRQSLADGSQEIVPGSRPTTFQASGDMGVGALERGAAAKRPDLFNARRAEQNTARLQAIDSMQPTGAPETVANAVRSHLQRLDLETQGIVERATEGAQARAGAIGRGMSPEASGDAMRGALEAARTQAKQAERALWDAVDPDGSLALGAAKARRTASDILRERPASAKLPSADEQAIYDVLDNYGDVVPFRELTALQSRLKTEMRQERLANGETPAYRRMTQINSAIEADLDTAVAGKVAQERQAVAAGQMDPEQTLEANFLRSVDVWKAGRAGEESRQSLSASAGPAGASRTTAFPSASGVRGQGGGGFPDPSGNPRLSGDDLQSNFDGAARERLNTAAAATRERAGTFDNRILAPIRRRPSTVSPYDMPAAAVPQRVFTPGPKGFEAVQTFRKAVGDQSAMDALEGYAIDRLRKTALREDGTFDPAKLSAWRRSHSDALRAFPDLDSRLADASSASETMAAVAAQRKQALDAAQKGKVGALIGIDDPQDVTRLVGSVFGRQDSVRQMGALRRVIGSDKQAAEGLRKSVADYIAGKFVGNTEAATTGRGTIRADQFQTFIRQNQSTLKAAGFDESEIANMQAIAADLQRANRSIASVKLPGGSNTAQDTLAVNGGDSASTLLAKLLLGASTTGSGAVGGFALGGGVGAVAGAIGGQLVGALRMNGIAAIDDLIADALLHPDRARQLLEAVKPREVEAAAISLAQRYRRAALAAMVQQDSDKAANDVAAALRKSGGAVRQQVCHSACNFDPLGGVIGVQN